MLEQELIFKPELLKSKMVEKKINRDFLAFQLGINPSTLCRKLKGESEFNRSEMAIIKVVLNLNKDDMNSIFFTEKLTETQEY